MVAIEPKCYGEVYNLGGEHMSLLELTRLLIALSSKSSYKIIPFPEEKKKIDIGSFYSDFSKLKAATGWEPKVALTEGLKETMSYYHKYKEHYL